MDYAKEFKKYATKHHGINSLYYEKIVSSMTPYIIEERQLNVAQMDVFSRLMMDRIMFLGTSITDSVANVIQAQLLFLQSTDSSRDIQLYINSPGGGVYAGLGIYDTMQFIKPDVATICTGCAASMSAILLCAGKKGKRSALKHSRVMIALYRIYQVQHKLLRQENLYITECPLKNRYFEEKVIELE